MLADIVEFLVCPVCRADLDRTQAFLGTATITRPARIVWRGDRIEWLLAHGFHEWFVSEIRAGRVAWPRRDDVQEPS